ncbi:hypothetical protein C0992_005159 [Termitomyces sp. T32_za158]|nr:hypothetical protein C0992_005159 [Termitomyces sp. T32_za158]
MGSSQSVLSQEAALTVAVIVGAVGFGYSKFGPSAATSISNTGTGAATSGKKGKKKKKAFAPSPASASESSVLSTPAPIVVPFPTVIPGSLDGTVTPEPEFSSSDAPRATKSKKKKNKVASSATSKQLDNGSTRPSSQTESTFNASGSTPSTDKNNSTTKNARKRTTQPSTSATSSPEATTRQLKQVQSSVSIDTDRSWTRVESHRNKCFVDIATTSASEADPTTGTSVKADLARNFYYFPFP